MRQKFVGNGPDVEITAIKNAETTNTIGLGEPVIWNLSQTKSTDLKDDGRAVVRAATAGVALYQLMAGVNLTANLAVGAFGESMLHGYCPYTLLNIASRANSTSSWASMPSIASGVLLVPDFNSNSWKTLANVAAQSSPALLMLDSVASFATAASNATGNQANVSTGNAWCVFVRSYIQIL